MFSFQMLKLLFLLPIICLLFSPSFVLAGFGITPPYVKNTSLTRNSVYEQKILLVRGEADLAQKAEIVIDAPEIEDWIYIKEGSEIYLPAGVQKVPITVQIKVPENAEYKNYKGSIRIRTMPADDKVAAGKVTVSLGALIDIDLTVLDRVIKDFRVRKVSVPDLNAGKNIAWLFFPGKIRFNMLIENTGNIDIAPSLVEFSIFDRTGKVLLESTKSLGKIKKIKPYLTDTVVANIPTRLPAGSYVARYRIFNEDNVVQEGDLSMNILPPGTLSEKGFGFSGLSLWHKISVILPILSLLLVIFYIWWSRKD